ncbi:hypothetical protein [Bifidobacterium catenulatum]|uniref:hypothetical protein n=1 Tax=Bifidobacterium catenulatum TaxID=1686 RepID=UPI003DA32F2F
MPIVGGSHEWTIAVAYALFMAASGFVLVPDQTHTLNQLPSSMNADCSAVMNAIQQLAGAIVLAAGGYAALFPIAVVAVLLGTVFIMLVRKVK